MKKSKFNFHAKKIEIIVFACGAVLMVLELTGTRILAPVVGTSIYVWTGTISVILTSLSIGYFLGGKVADKNPSMALLSDIIFASSILHLPILIFSELSFSHLKFSPDPRLLSLLYPFLLFSSPGMLLGMVTPIALKIKIRSLEHAGSVSGNLYAYSTLGSIFGTLTTGYYLFAIIGSNRIILLLSFILVLLSFFADVKRKQLYRLIFLVFLFIIHFYLDSFGKILNKNLVADYDSQYNRILIYDSKEKNSGNPVRILSLNGELTSAMYLKKNDLVYKYTRYFKLANYFNPNIKKALMIGGGGYSYPKDFLQKFPDAELNVVEIDPQVTSLAKKYFELKDNSRLKIYTEDARLFINREKSTYDAIIIDAFNSYVVPFHLTTVEAINRFYNLLNRDGIIIINILSAIEGHKSKFFQGEYQSYSAKFPQLFAFAVNHKNNKTITQNIIIVALKSRKNIPGTDLNPEISDFLNSKIDIKDKKSEAPLLTDNFSPIEYYSLLNMIK